MSSIPLPALQIQPPQQPDILGQYGKALSLRSLMQGQQLQGLQIQQQQNALRDQQAMTSAMQQWDGQDLNQLPSLMIKRGASAQAVIGMKQHILQQKQMQSEMAKNDAETGAKNLDTLTKKFDMMGGAINQILKSPDAELPNAITQGAQGLRQSGVLDDQHLQQAAQIAQVAQQNPAAARAQLQAMAKMSMGAKAQAEQTAKEAETRLQTANAGIAENKLRLIQSANPADYTRLVDQVVPPTGANSALNARTKTLVNFAISRGDLDGAQRALAEATNQVGAIEKETNPAVINARVGQAVSTEVGKARAMAPPLETLTRTTISGNKYVSADDLGAGEQGNYLRQQAARAGVPVVAKDTSETLSEIDTAKANQGYMLNVIGKKLATDASGRLYSAPKNTIERLAQTDPEMAAVGTFRNAAIQSMRAVAGSKGLRINQYEVQMAIDNDIPKLTDTLPTAQAKLKNLQAFLNNAEQSHLLRNRTQMGAGQQGGAIGGQTGAPQNSNDPFAQFGGKAHQ